MCLVFLAIRLSAGYQAGASGRFCVDAGTAPLRSKDAAPGSHAWVRVLALIGLVGRAGLPGAFWCPSPFLWPFLVVSPFAQPTASWCSPVLFVLFSFASPFPLFLPLALRPRCLQLSAAFVPWCPGPWRLVAAPPPPLVLFICSPLCVHGRRVFGLVLFSALCVLALGAIGPRLPPLLPLGFLFPFSPPRLSVVALGGVSGHASCVLLRSAVVRLIPGVLQWHGGPVRVQRNLWCAVCVSMYVFCECVPSSGVARRPGWRACAVLCCCAALCLLCFVSLWSRAVLFFLVSCCAVLNCPAGVSSPPPPPRLR